MYSRYAPLWASTYHAFQMSPAGKYRYGGNYDLMARTFTNKKDIVPPEGVVDPSIRELARIIYDWGDAKLKAEFKGNEYEVKVKGKTEKITKTIDKGKEKDRQDGKYEEIKNAEFMDVFSIIKRYLDTLYAIKIKDLDGEDKSVCRYRRFAKLGLNFLIQVLNDKEGVDFPEVTCVRERGDVEEKLDEIEKAWLERDTVVEVTDVEEPQGVVVPKSKKQAFIELYEAYTEKCGNLKAEREAVLNTLTPLLSKDESNCDDPAVILDLDLFGKNKIGFLVTSGTQSAPKTFISVEKWNGKGIDKYSYIKDFVNQQPTTEYEGVWEKRKKSEQIIFSDDQCTKSVILSGNDKLNRYYVKGYDKNPVNYHDAYVIEQEIGAMMTAQTITDIADVCLFQIANRENKDIGIPLDVIECPDVGEYNLIAIMWYSRKGKHWIATVKRGDTWYTCDDTSITEINDSGKRRSMRNTRYNGTAKFYDPIHAIYLRDRLQTYDKEPCRLTNLASRCWLNSAMQSLFTIPDLMKEEGSDFRPVVFEPVQKTGDKTPPSQSRADEPPPPTDGKKRKGRKKQTKGEDAFIDVKANFNNMWEQFRTEYPGFIASDVKIDLLKDDDGDTPTVDLRITRRVERNVDFRSKKDMIGLNSTNLQQFKDNGCFASSKVIKFYVAMLQQRENDRVKNKKEPISEFFFDTNLFGHFTMKGRGITGRERHVIQNLDYANLKRIYIPMYEDSHFTLFVVHLKEKEIRFYNSLPGGPDDRKKKKKTKIPFIKQCLDYMRTYNSTDEVLSWMRNVDLKSIVNTVDLSEHKQRYYQAGTNTCAVYCCQFMNELSKNPGGDADYKFREWEVNAKKKPDSVEYYREKMTMEIINEELYPVDGQANVTKGNRATVEKIREFVPYEHYLHAYITQGGGERNKNILKELNELCHEQGACSNRDKCDLCEKKKAEEEQERDKKEREIAKRIEKAKEKEEKEAEKAAAKKAKEAEKAAAKKAKEVEKAATKKAKEAEKAATKKAKEAEKAGRKEAERIKKLVAKEAKEAEKAAAKEAKEAEKVAAKKKRKEEEAAAKKAERIKKLAATAVTSQLLTITDDVFGWETYSEDPYIIAHSDTNYVEMEKLVYTPDRNEVYVEKTNDYKEYRIENVDYSTSVLDDGRFQGVSTQVKDMMDPIRIPKNVYEEVSTDAFDMAYTRNKWKEFQQTLGDNATIPSEVQKKLLVANPRDVLIAHQPGEGKTATAILFAEMKRNQVKLKKPRIYVITPNESILLQWQQTVLNWGFDPRHWVFQTHRTFQLTRTRPKYPKYDYLDEESKELIRNVWKEGENGYTMEKPDMKQYLDVSFEGFEREPFNPPIDNPTRRNISKRLRESVLDVRTGQFINDIREMQKEQNPDPVKITWNGLNWTDLQRLSVCLVDDGVKGWWLDNIGKNGQYMFTYEMRKDAQNTETSDIGRITLTEDFTFDNARIYNNVDTHVQKGDTLNEPRDSVKQRLISVLQPSKTFETQKTTQYYNMNELTAFEWLYTYVGGSTKQANAEKEKMKEWRFEVGDNLMYFSDPDDDDITHIISDLHTDAIIQRDTATKQVRLPLVGKSIETQSGDMVIVEILSKETFNFIGQKLDLDLKPVSDNVSFTSFKEVKDAIFEQMKEKHGAIEYHIGSLGRTAFHISGHSDELVDHQYRVENETILIVDEVHDMLSTNEKKITTRTLLDYTTKTSNNIFVSATPFQGSNVKKRLKLMSKFLQRQDDRDDYDKNYDMENEQDSFAFQSMLGKVTRASYLQPDTDDKIARIATYSNIDRPLKHTFFGHKLKMSFKPPLPKWRQNDLKQKGLLRLFMKPSEERKGDKAFPDKIPMYGDGYKEVTTDDIRQYAHCNADLAYLPRPQRSVDIINTLKVHTDLMQGLQDVIKIPNFLPIVVSVKDKNDNLLDPILNPQTHSDILALKALQRKAYNTFNKWIVVICLQSTEDTLKDILARVNVMRFDSLKNRQLENTKTKITFNADSRKLLETLKVPVTKEKDDGDTVQWLQLASSSGNKLRYTIMPEILSSKVRAIVELIEKSVASGKNVLVYNTRVRMLNAIERGLMVHRNRYVKFNAKSGAVDSDWIEGQISKKKKKWERWDTRSRENEIRGLNKLFNERTEQNGYAALNEAMKTELEKSSGDIKRVKPFTYVTVRDRKKAFRLTTERWTSHKGFWDTEDGEFNDSICTPLTSYDYETWALKDIIGRSGGVYKHVIGAKKELKTFPKTEVLVWNILLTYIQKLEDIFPGVYLYHIGICKSQIEVLGVKELELKEAIGKKRDDYLERLSCDDVLGGILENFIRSLSTVDTVHGSFKTYLETLKFNSDESEYTILRSIKWCDDCAYDKYVDEETLKPGEIARIMLFMRGYNKTKKDRERLGLDKLKLTKEIKDYIATAKGKKLSKKEKKEQQQKIKNLETEIVVLDKYGHTETVEQLQAAIDKLKADMNKTLTGILKQVDDINTDDKTTPADKMSDSDTVETYSRLLHANVWNTPKEQTVAEQTMRRISTMVENKVSFSLLTGNDNKDDRFLAKHAFAIGAVDCLLINKSMSVGIDYKSPRETVCIITEPLTDPGEEDQFIGRVVRNQSHALCPEDFRKVSYVTFGNKPQAHKRSRDGDEDDSSDVIVSADDTSRSASPASPSPEFPIVPNDGSIPVSTPLSELTKKVIDSATSYMETELLISSVCVYKNHAFLSPLDLIRYVQENEGLPNGYYCYRCDKTNCGKCTDEEHYKQYYKLDMNAKSNRHYQEIQNTEKDRRKTYGRHRNTMIEYDLSLASIAVDHGLRYEEDMNCKIEHFNAALKSRLTYFKRLNNAKEKKPPEHNGINYALPNRKEADDVLQLIYNK